MARLIRPVIALILAARLLVPNLLNEFDVFKRPGNKVRFECPECLKEVVRTLKEKPPGIRDDEWPNEVCPKCGQKPMTPRQLVASEAG